MLSSNIDFTKTDISQKLNQALPVILSTAEEILQMLVGLPEYEEGRSGGYLSIRQKLADEVLLCNRLGIIPHQDDADPQFQTKARKYLHCSLEKAERLIAMAYKHRHIASSQSRDEKEYKYSGAVWCDEFAVSFSGLPELADEALCLTLALHFGWISTERADKIVALSSNPYFHPLWDAWKKTHSKK